ncbi:MAG: hypothetical protein ACM30G_13035 [Micromonosporaceae bacterium]
MHVVTPRRTAHGRSSLAQAGLGVGYAPAHHGELLQGMFQDSAGRFRRALVTLPYPDRGSRAVFRPSQSHWGIVGTPDLIKVRRAALVALREFSSQPSPAKGGQIEITSDIQHGIGMGSSTSDVTATIRAIADYYRVPLQPEDVARLAVLAECAADSIMIENRVVLFAHREGVVLETLGHRLPPMIVVGCDARPGAIVDTLGLTPAEYDDHELGAFSALRGALRRAIATEDVALLGRVATASARINQRFVPSPLFEPLLELCLSNGGAGVQVAHSGTVAGLIFDARSPGVELAVRRVLDGIGELGLTLTAAIGPGNVSDLIEPAGDRPLAHVDVGAPVG